MSGIVACFADQDVDAIAAVHRIVAIAHVERQAAGAGKSLSQENRQPDQVLPRFAIQIEVRAIVFVAAI